jgi:phosphoserine phosphatase
MRSCRWIITPGAAAGCCTDAADKRRLTAWQRELGAALVIVASWVVEDYQVIRLAGSLTLRATRLAHEAGLDVAPLGKIPHLRTPGCW